MQVAHPADRPGTPVRRTSLIGAFSSSLLSGVVLLFGGHALAQPRIPPKYSAAPLEVAQLPKYCWAQYVDGAYAGHPVYSIPSSCGAYTNHFCPALVSLTRAQQMSRNESQRREDIRHAAMEIRYTLRYMQPSCPIYPEVKAAQMQAEFLEKLLK